MSSSESNQDFSLDNLKTYFEKCVGEDGKTLYLDKYILGNLLLIYFRFSLLNKEKKYLF